MKTILVTVGIIIIIVVVGLALFRSTGDEEIPEARPLEFVEEPANGDTSSQFLQLQPTSLPAGGPTVESTPDSLGSTTDEFLDTEGVEEADVDVTAGESVTISIDESGFIPSTVTVTTGTMVTFINNGQGPHWPASDVHPTHQNLPEFDAKRGLLTGETYSYTFTKQGSWGMHDHLNPSATGTIVVE